MVVVFRLFQGEVHLSLPEAQDHDDYDPRRLRSFLSPAILATPTLSLLQRFLRWRVSQMGSCAGPPVRQCLPV